MKTLEPTQPSELAGILQSAEKKPGRIKLIALGLTLTAVLALVWGARQKRAGEAAPAYLTEPITRGDLNLTITATGTLQPTNKVTIGSEISGLVVEVLVQSNDRVIRGQPLAKLDPTKLAQQSDSARAAVRSAEAKVLQAEATLRQNDATLARHQELHRLSAGRLPATADLEAATAAVERARGDLASAQALVAETRAALQVTENDFAKTIIRSPIDGLVLTRNIEPGQTVAATFTAPELFVIAENLERLKLTVAIAEADIGQVRASQAATFAVDAWPDRAYSAVVAKVAFGSAVVDNVVTYQAELQVDNADLTLRPGMTATVDIRAAERKNVLLVPTPAFRFVPVEKPSAATAQKSLAQSLVPLPPTQPGKSTPLTLEKTPPGTARLWVLREGEPHPVIVRPGISDGRRTEVSADALTAGLPVVLRLNNPVP